MQVEAVLFDLFDTLLLLEKEEIYYEACLKKMHEFLTENGIAGGFNDFSKVYFDVRDKFYSESRQTLEEPHFKVRVSQTLHILGYKYDASHPIVIGATNVFADEFMQYVTLDKEALNVLRKLREKYRLGLVSNFGLPECGRKLLEIHGLSKFFDAIVISGEINQRKPSPKIFERTLKALNVDSSKAVFVGDMLDLDIRGPKNVGMKTVLIERRSSKGGTDVKPDFTVKTLSELLTIL
jgi:HAD superfamily hydrolase (TIGR01549 family)